MNEHEKMLITKYDLLFESRLTKTETLLTALETTMKDIKLDIREIKNEMKNDFKYYLYMYAAGYLSLVGIMAKGFKWFQ